MPHVLVVDDEEKFRSLVCRFLAGRGYDTRTAASGEDALTVLETYEPDIILLDVRMPGMSGLDLLRRLRGRPRFPKVIMITAMDTPEIMDEAKALGAAAYLYKPLNLAKLGEVLSSGT